jgi:hypothetical protein
MNDGAQAFKVHKKDIRRWLDVVFMQAASIMVVAELLVRADVCPSSLRGGSKLGRVQQTSLSEYKAVCSFGHPDWIRHWLMLSRDREIWCGLWLSRSKKQSPGSFLHALRLYLSRKTIFNMRTLLCLLPQYFVWNVYFTLETVDLISSKSMRGFLLCTDLQLNFGFVQVQSINSS